MSGETSIPPSGPLSGLRILEMEALGPLPLAGTLLAGFGADVVRITRAGAAATPDPVVRGRRVMTLDLKSGPGRAMLLDLVAHADALMEGFRPGTMEKLGLGPADCHAANPALVYARMTGWGQDGPLAQEAGHDINYIAVAGALGRFVGEGGRPGLPINLVGDYGGGTMPLLFGLMTALWQARATGRGEVIDAAMVDGTATLMAKQYAWHGQGYLGAPGTNLLDGGAFFYDTYTCADGRHVAVGAIEPKFYAALLEVLGLAPADLPPQHDKARWPEGRRIFAARFATRARDEWVTLAEGRDACLSPVLTLDEAIDHPQAQARASFARAADGAVLPLVAPRFGSMAGQRMQAEGNTETDLATLLDDWAAGRADQDWERT